MKNAGQPGRPVVTEPYRRIQKSPGCRLLILTLTLTVPVLVALSVEAYSLAFRGAVTTAKVVDVLGSGTGSQTIHYQFTTDEKTYPGTAVVTEGSRAKNDVIEVTYSREFPDENRTSFLWLHSLLAVGWCCAATVAFAALKHCGH